MSGECATHKRLVLACGALAHDLVHLIRQDERIANVVKLHCLPAKLHNTPQLIAPEVEKYLEKHSKDYHDIFVAYADCGTGGELDKVLTKYNAQRLSGGHCYEFFAGTGVFSQLMDEEVGSFFLTDYLVKNFQRLVIEGLGLDRYPELFDDYFSNYKRVVFLAQQADDDLKEKAREIATSMHLDFDYRLVGMQGLQPVINHLHR